MNLGERLHDYFSPHQRVETSPKVADEVKCTTCYMCACRCGIKVHLKDGGIRYIEGNRDHPVNRGVICGKGASGIMQQYSPAKLRKPLRRVGERGSGEFREIEWAEAIATAVDWLSPIRDSDPKKLAFFTGRDQSQSLTGFWAAQFGTPNFAAHGGFCSVNMAAAGMYTLGSSFWEFGEPDWAHTRFFMMFGVAEDHDSNPIKIALSGLRRRGAKFVSVNPVRTGYSAIADEWIGIKPGTDGLFVLALVHELLKGDRVDLDYLVRYTNAAWLVIQAPGAPDDGLFARNETGEPLVLEPSGALANGMAADGSARLVGEAALPDGRRAVPVFQLVAERYLDPCYAPEAVAETCGIPATTIRRLAVEMAHAGVRRANRAARAMDRLGRTPPCFDARSPGLAACDARDLRAFKRVPDLPRAAFAADAPRHDRCAGRVALQVTASEAVPSRAETRGQTRADRPRKAAAGCAARLSALARGSDHRWRRPTRPNRQSFLLGCPDRRARHDAYGHRQCVEG